ncbi:MAG: META domain-containing protein [Planctomycetota bacterium]
MKSLIASLFAAAALCACAGAPVPRPARLPDLTGSWQLAAPVPAGARIPTMTVGQDGSVHGNAGVNRYRGTLDATALGRGQWRAGPFAGTRMAGAPQAMQLEQDFLGALERADTAELHGDRLVLLQGGAPVVELMRPQLP